jgi:hypothetical protein
MIPLLNARKSYRLRGQGEVERAAFPHFAFHPDLAAMRFDHLFGNGKA